MDERIPLLSLKSEGHSTNTIDLAPIRKNTKNQLGTINGCFVPCCLTIMSAVLFLRLGWATGEAGILQTVGMLLIGEAMTTMTALSLSAIVTNGDMRGGGSYYMISRSLGPEYGGAIGVCFFLAYSVGVSFHAISMGTEIQETWFPTNDSSPHWTIVWISSALLFTILLISLAGAHVFTKFNVALFGIEMGVILMGVISFLVPHDYLIRVDSSNFTARIDFPNHFTDNLFSNYSSFFDAGIKDNPCHGDCNFQKVFSIIFPMVTGIMEGANLSGDLKNPARSIPVGTLYAIFVSGSVYLLIIVIQGASFDRFWLVNDLSSFQNATLGTRYVVVVGILIASYSSALGAIFGGSRLLQAIARDNLFPPLKIFAFGSSKGDEPRVAVILTWLIAQSCVMAGSLDVIAPVITSFFCLAYSLVNMTCVLLSVTGVPNFRPRFKYFSVWTALLGFCINFAIMFFLNWIYALIGISALFLIFLYLALWGPSKDWGEISQALMFHQVRKYLLRLNPIATHSKFWRPNILLLLDNPSTALIGLCGSLKWGGLLIVGQGVVSSLEAAAPLSKPLRDAWVVFTRNYSIKAFPQVTIGTNYRSSASSLIQGAGLGGLSCNTVCLPLLKINEQGGVIQPASKQHREGYIKQLVTVMTSSPISADRTVMDEPYYNLPVEDSLEYCHVLQDVLRLERNLIMSCNFDKGVHKATSFGSKNKFFVGVVSPKKYTDIWLVGDLKSNHGPGALPALWGYSSSILKVHSQVFSLKRFVDGGSDEDGVHMSGLQGLVALLLQLGSIADGSRVRATDGQKYSKIGKIRVFHVVSTPLEAMDSASERLGLASMLNELCKKARVDLEPTNVSIIMPEDIAVLSGKYRQLLGVGSIPIPLHELSPMDRAIVVNELVNAHSVDTFQVVLPLPFPSSQDLESSTKYVHMLNALTRLTPPTLLICNGEDGAFISTCI